MSSNIGWMYDPENVAGTARDGARAIIRYLTDKGDLPVQKGNDLYRRVVFQYKNAPWYSVFWKKLWPWANKDSFILTIGFLELPELEE